MTSKSFLGIHELQRQDIQDILLSIQKIKALSPAFPQTLQGKTLVNLFYEPSTRTRVSFELAGRRLGGLVINISGKDSSLSKGETLTSTTETLQAMGVDAIVLRHEEPGAAHFLSAYSTVPIINAGDGIHEHPTQALADLLTVQEHFKGFKDLTLTIIGDIAYSRVARSSILSFHKMGVEVRVVGPLALIPKDIQTLGCTVYHTLENALKNTNIIYCLRIQHERHTSQTQAHHPNLQSKLFSQIPKNTPPTHRHHLDRYLEIQHTIHHSLQNIHPANPSFNIQDYKEHFGVRDKHIKLANDNAIIMHPGPVNENIELSAELIRDKRSKIQEQVRNGLLARTTLLHTLLS